MPQGQVKIQSLGELSRLETTPESQARYAQQLPAIVDYVGKLQSLGLVQTPAQPRSAIMYRSDRAEVSPAIESILAEAPERQERWFKVRSVF